MIINTIRNKRIELLVSLGMVMILLVVASLSMYFLEHSSQPEVFPNIYSAILWGIDKYLTTVGVGNIDPITPAGKLLGGFIAVLGIGMFALPAGIIASGFVEEIENEKERKDLQMKEAKLKHAFTVEYFGPVRNIKKGLGLSHLPRKWLSMDDIKYKLHISETDVMKVCDLSESFRLRNVKFDGVDKAGLELITLNRSYGHFIDRKSNITIVNLYSEAQPFFGHFSLGIADILQANYISNEVFNSVSMMETKQLDLVVNPAYVDSTEEDEVITQLKNDVTALLSTKTTCVFMVNASTSENLIQFNTGGVVGDDSFENGEFFSNLSRINEIYDQTQVVAEKYGMHVAKHNTVGIPVPEHITHFIKANTGCDIVMLHTNVGVLKKKAKVYYQIMADVASVFGTSQIS